MGLKVCVCVWPEGGTLEPKLSLGSKRLQIVTQIPPRGTGISYQSKI